MYKYSRLVIGVFFMLYIPLLSYVVMGVLHKKLGVKTGLVIVDQELRPYLDKFVEEGEKRGKQIVVSDLLVIFGETRSEAEPNRIGYCASTYPKSIVIDRKVFNELDIGGREMLMFHEFGHCILDRGHDEGCYIDEYPCKFPTSVMYPSVVSTYYLKNRELYLDELFSK